MKERVCEYMKQQHMLKAGQKVLAGVSGGADSVCLLLLLYELQQEMDFTLAAAVHVNHMIRRQEAERDAAFVEALCHRLAVPFFLEQADVPALAKERGATLEEVGRQVRYSTFLNLGNQLTAGEVSKEDKTDLSVVVAVAHHQDDSNETMLMNLFRGSGLAGLTGIAPVRDLQLPEGRLRVIRPLLCVSREEIEGELHRRQQTFVTDSTNLLTEGARNCIRNRILPDIRGLIQPEIATVLHTERQLFLEIDDYLQQQADIYLKDPSHGVWDEELQSFFLRISSLEKQHPAVIRYILRRVISQVSGRVSVTDMSMRHIQMIMDLMEKQSGREVLLPGGFHCRRSFDWLELWKETGQQSENRGFPFGLQLDWHQCSLEVEKISVSEDFFEKNEKIIRNSLYTKWVDCDKIEQSVLLRTRETGDFLCVNEALNQKKLKNYMIDEKIPQQYRQNWPVVADGKHIIWVCGYRISEAYKVTRNTRQVLKLVLHFTEETGGTETHERSHSGDVQ